MQAPITPGGQSKQASRNLTQEIEALFQQAGAIVEAYAPDAVDLQS
jgi:hypothetical protein